MWIKRLSILVVIVLSAGVDSISYGQHTVTGKDQRINTA